MFFALDQDGSGNVYAVGSTRLLGCNYESAVVRKVSPDGGTVWTDEFVGSNEACENVRARGVVALGEDDLIVLAGQGNSLPSTLLRRYGVVDEALAETWSVLSSSWVRSPRTIAALNSGVLVGGRHNPVEALFADGALMSYSEDGEFIEGTVVEGPANTAYLSSLDTDSVGGYAVAAIWGGNSDLAVRSYSPDGALRWSRVLDEVSAGASDDPGGAVGFGPGDTLAVCANASDGEVIVRRYATDGELDWSSSLQFGGQSFARCFDVAVHDGTEDIVVVGVFDEGNEDALVARFSSSGEELWVQVFPGLTPSANGGIDPTAAYAVSFSTDDAVLVAGAIGVVNTAGDRVSDAVVWKLVP